jgi:hypothetical protein
VVDALVELVLNPCAGIGARQERRGAHDQIVEIEEATRAFEPFVARDQPISEGQSRAGVFEHAKKLDTVGDAGDFLTITLELVRKLRKMLANALGHDGLGRARLERGARTREKRLAQVIDTLDRVGGGAGCAEIFGKLQRKLFAGLRSARANVAGKGRREVVIGPKRGCNGPPRVAAAEVELFKEARKQAVIADIDDKTAQGVALGNDIAEQRFQRRLTSALQDGGKGIAKAGFTTFGGAGDHLAARFGDERSFHLAVEQFEMASNIGFKRELVQHRFAESVDGLDFQATRRLQRPRKQASGALKAAGARIFAVELLDSLSQLIIWQRGPTRQVLEDTRCHVGSGSAGIGEAQDA